MLSTHLATVRRRIHGACRRVRRDPAGILLIGVTKGFGAATVSETVAVGITDIGESRVQEAREKQAALGELGVRWHLIGHLQRNKVNQAVKLFDVVHSVDDMDLAEALARACGDRSDPLDVFVQVNIAGEATKHGCSADNAPVLAHAVAAASQLRLRGLMTIAPYADDPETARPVFRRLRELRERVAAEIGRDAAALQLSMGMSHDFEVAIEEGADVVRIGTALFGMR